MLGEGGPFPGSALDLRLPVQRLGHEAAVFPVAHFGHPDADDSEVLGQFLLDEDVEDRRNQLALGKVAGSAEDDEDERADPELRFRKIAGLEGGNSRRRCR